jgi:hypothetical protein
VQDEVAWCVDEARSRVDSDEARSSRLSAHQRRGTSLGKTYHVPGLVPLLFRILGVKLFLEVRLV